MPAARRPGILKRPTASGVFRADLRQQGQSIGYADEMIAAHALALDCTLVTDNVRHFQRVAGLRLENWL